MEPNLELNGALLIDKPAGISSFGVIERLQKSLTERTGVRRRDLPKIGHGGTLDPFATGLLLVCVGRAVKLARYFLGSIKEYEGTIRFGETTIPGDPTEPVSETSDHYPASLEELRAAAREMTLLPYLQTPPMHSAKKKDGKPLYELARQGIEVEREAKSLRLYEFEILSYEKPRATFRVRCSSGTYVRTLTQDFARKLGTVALLETLRRTASGNFRLENALTLDALCAGGTSLQAGAYAKDATPPWNQTRAWMPFDRLLEGYARAQATEDEARALVEGRQNVLFNILKRAEALPPESMPASTPAPGTPTDLQGASIEDLDAFISIYQAARLVAIARRDGGVWSLERVFT